MKFKISILLVSGLLATALGAPQQRQEDEKSDLDTSNRGTSDSQGAAQTQSGRQSPSAGQQNTSSAAPNSGSEEFYGSTSAEENDVDDFGPLEGAPQQGQPQFLAQNPQGFSPQQGFNQFSPFAGVGGAGRFADQQAFIGPNGQLIGGGQGSPQFFNQQGLPVQSFSPQAQFQGQQGLNQFGGGVIQPGQFQGQFNGLNGLGQPQFQNGAGAGAFQFAPDSGSGSAEFNGFPGNRPQLAGGRPLPQGQVGGVVGGAAGRPQQPFDSVRGGLFASGPQSTGFPILTTTALRGQPQQVQALNEGEFNTSLEGGEFNDDAEQDGVNNVLPQSPVRAATPSRLTTNTTPSTDGTPFGGPQVSRQNLGLRGNVNFPGGVQGNPLVFNGPQGPQIFNGQGQQITEAQLQQLLGGGPQGPQQGPAGFRPGAPQQQQQFNQQFQQFNPQQQQQQFNPQQFQQFNPNQFQQFNPQFGGFSPNGFSPIQGFQGNQINGAFPGSQGQQQFTTNPQGVSGVQQQQSPNAGFIQGGAGPFSPSSGGVQQFNSANGGAPGAGGPRPGSVGFPVGFPVGAQQGNPQQQFIQGGGVGGPGGQPQFIGQQQGGVNGIQSAQGFGGPFDYSPFGINGGIVGANGQVFPGQFGGQPGGIIGGPGGVGGGAFSPFGQQGGVGGFPGQGQFLSSAGQQGGLGGVNGGVGQRNSGAEGGAQGSGGAASSASQESTKSASASDESKKST